MTNQTLVKNPLALVIEDDNKLADIYAQALQAAQFETEIIPDGHLALERLSVITPAIVILDLNLPHVSGEAILRQIRADTRLEQTRVMLATADPRRAETIRSKADLVLLKPVTFGQLRDLAKRLRPPNAPN